MQDLLSGENKKRLFFKKQKQKLFSKGFFKKHIHTHPCAEVGIGCSPDPDWAASNDWLHYCPLSFARAGPMPSRRRTGPALQPICVSLLKGAITQQKTFVSCMEPCKDISHARWTSVHSPYRAGLDAGLGHSSGPGAESASHDSTLHDSPTLCSTWSPRNCSTDCRDGRYNDLPQTAWEN